MKINRRINAFTILEVTVSMLLAAICVVIAYTSYRVISSSYREFDQKNKKIAEFMMVDKLLKRDMAVCENAIRYEDGIILSMPEGEIIYQFQPEYILRNQFHLRADTLWVQSAGLKASFEQGEVVMDGPFDRLMFSAIINKNEVPMVYVKEYSAAELFNDKNN